MRGRRSAFATAALAAVLATAVLAAPAQAGPRGAYWGTFIRARGGETQLQAMKALEAKIGRKFHAFRLYRALDNTNLRAPLIRVMKKRRIPLYLNISSELGRSCVPWSAVAAGRYNRDLRSIAHQITWYRRRVYFSWNHEPLENCTGGGPAAYKESYHRVHRLFRNEHVRNVRWVWTPTSHNFRQDLSVIRKYEPRRYDLVGVDGYNQGAVWRSAKDIFGAAHAFAARRGKNLAICEIGTDEDPSDPMAKARWITAAASTFKRWHVRLIVWTNAVTSQGDYWADTSANALAAYRAAGKMGYYDR
jgi:hypothetical protein